MSLRAKFFALTYDRQMSSTENAGLRALRERLLAGASGDVLEIGGGTGANLPCYDSILAAGFTADEVEHTALPKASPFVRPAILGSATVPAAAAHTRPGGARPAVAPAQGVNPPAGG